MVIPERVDPDCAGGKHRACPGWTWDDVNDRACVCECPCHEEPTQ